jgi:hypothetical protein
MHSTQQRRIVAYVEQRAALVDTLEPQVAAARAAAAIFRSKFVAEPTTG